jgi:AcrR family transcriptional regulator
MPRRPGLDKAAVVQAAVDLLDDEGPNALSLKALSDRLGVQTPSLYNHVDGMPGLLRELSLRNALDLGTCLGDAAMGRSGAPALEAVAQAYRSYIKQHPGLYMASLRASGAQMSDSTPLPGTELPGTELLDNGLPYPALAAAEERVVRVVMAVLASFGLEGDDALHAVRGLRSLVHGFASLEIAGGFGLALDCDESFRRLLAMFIRGLEGMPS